MKCRWRKLITVVVLLAVIYVLISPLFVLDPSANRAWRVAIQLLLSIALTALLPTGLSIFFRHLEIVSEVTESRGSPDPSLISCVSLC